MADVIVLGRADPSGSSPDLDLEPFGAAEKGVSRRHATITVQDGVFVISDTDSANGTYVNGHRLQPHEAHILQAGDELRLGRLIARVYLE